MDTVNENYSAQNLIAAASLSALAALPAAILLMLSLLLFGAHLDHVGWTMLLMMLALVPVGAFAGVMFYALPIILILNRWGGLTPIKLGIMALVSGPLLAVITSDYRPQLIIVICYHALIVAAVFWQVINRMPKRRRRSSGYLAPL